MDRQLVIDLERRLRNLARQRSRSGEAEAASAYRYAAWLIRDALKEGK